MIRHLVVAGALLAGLVAGACGGAGPEPPNPVTGLITAIQGDRLTLTTAAGHAYTFEIADPTVPIEHLEVHRRDALPVRIGHRGTGDGRIATTIEDA